MNVKIQNKAKEVLAELNLRHMRWHLLHDAEVCESLYCSLFHPDGPKLSIKINGTLLKKPNTFEEFKQILYNIVKDCPVISPTSEVK